jgi:hypothetical protein
MSSDDHDILIEIRNDLKHLVSNFNDHVVDDAKNFKKLNDDGEWTKKLLWTSMGAGGIIVLVLQLIK